LTVDETDPLALKTQKHIIICHRKKTATSTDDTIPLEPSAPDTDSSSSSGSEDNLFKKTNLEWAKSDDSVFYGPLVENNTAEIRTAQSIDLSSIALLTFIYFVLFLCTTAV